jgi:hypothetical protein
MDQRVQPTALAINTKTIKIRMGLSCALQCIDPAMDFFRVFFCPEKAA